MRNAIKKNQSPATVQVPSAVHRVTPSDPHHQNTQYLVLDVADNPAVPDTVAPQPAERATQRLAQFSRVFQYGDPLVHVIDGALSRLPVESTEVGSGRVGVLNCPGQAARTIALPCPYRPFRCSALTSSDE